MVFYSYIFYLRRFFENPEKNKKISCEFPYNKHYQASRIWAMRTWDNASRFTAKKTEIKRKVFIEMEMKLTSTVIPIIVKVGSTFGKNDEITRYWKAKETGK